MQFRADKGERAEHGEAFEEDGREDDADPRRLEHARGRDGGLAPAGAPWRHGAETGAAHLENEHAACHEVQDGDGEHGHPPAREIAEDATHGLAADDPHDLSGEKAREDRLALVVGHHIADPRHRQRDDRGGTGAGKEAEGHERHQLRHRCAQCRHAARHQRSGRDHEELAAGIGQGPRADLGEAVGNRKGGDDGCRIADRDGELGRDLRQEAVADAQVGGARESRKGQEDEHPSLAVGEFGGGRRAHGRFRIGRTSPQRAGAQIVSCRGEGPDASGRHARLLCAAR